MKEIPFFANLADGTHCYQAALKMVLTFFTDTSFSFEELDSLTGKQKGKWTWPTRSLLWLLENGFEIKLIEEFSYEDFARRGKGYLIEKWGEEVANAQEENSDLAVERKLAVDFAKKSTAYFQPKADPPNQRRTGPPLAVRIPKWNDLEELLKGGYLTICNINACLLYCRPGYSGHFVLPIKISPDEILLHDPGLPPNPSWRCSRKTFENAWGYPSIHERNILAIRPVRQYLGGKP